MKFSCPHCGQHISAEDTWAGHSIQCPACQNSLQVPQIQTAPTGAPAPTARVSNAPPEDPKPVGAKLAPGVTQVARSTAHAPAPIKRAVPRRAPGDNALLRYGVLAVIVVVLASAGYFYGLPLVKGALGSSDAGSGSGGAAGGPMGSVNEAMDVSETLDSGSSSSRRRPAPANTNTVRPRPASPPK